MGMAIMGMGIVMMIGACATRQLMDKSSKMRKFCVKRNLEDPLMS